MSGENQLQKSGTPKVLPIPANEMERLLALNELELDYSDPDQTFSDLTKLAAKIAGTSISVINLIDTFTQWSVASFGIDVRQTPREKSVCQYTIMEENSSGLEVKDLSADDRFKDRSYVAQFPYFKYYFGIPLKINNNLSIGSLCVIDEDYKNLSDEKKQMLEIIAQEIVNRIKIRQALAIMKRQVQESNAIKNMVAHDIRGPIGGIVGLAEIIHIQGENNRLEDVLNYITLIQKSGQSVLDLADEILSVNQESIVAKKPKDHEFTLPILVNKLVDLFEPQAIAKHISLTVESSSIHHQIPFPKTNILQILGNLISNSIKFTPEGGSVAVSLELKLQERSKELRIKVRDTGVGMHQSKVEEILSGGTKSSEGTSGEKGYGFGLKLIHHLVTNLKGQMLINSEPGQGAEFELILPFS